MDPVRLCAVPLLSEEDCHINLSKITAYAEEASSGGAGLLLFPEAALTGYCPSKAADHSLTADSQPVKAIVELAERTGLVISCGFMERIAKPFSADPSSVKSASAKPFSPGLTAHSPKESSFCLTQLITDGTHTQFYRKTHLGYREKTIFTSGDDLPVFISDKAVIGTHLCWESHIPEIAGVFRGKGAEIILIPYASGMSGDICRDVWSRHLPARASDNGVYVAACNALALRKELHSGTDPFLPAIADNSVKEALVGGGCAVYDPKGRLIASDFSREEKLLTCELEADLPRDHPEGDMAHISYFDRRRPELYR